MDPEVMTWTKVKSRWLNQLSHLNGDLNFFVFLNFVYIPGSGKVMETLFPFLRSFWSLSQSGCHVLHPHQLGTRVGISPHSPPDLFNICVLRLAILVGVTWLASHGGFD